MAPKTPINVLPMPREAVEGRTVEPGAVDAYDLSDIPVKIEPEPDKPRERRRYDMPAQVRPKMPPPRARRTKKRK